MTVEVTTHSPMPLVRVHVFDRRTFLRQIQGKLSLLGHSAIFLLSWVNISFEAPMISFLTAVARIRGVRAIRHELSCH